MVSRKAHWEYLREVSLFATCTDRELSLIARLGEGANAVAGDVVVEQGAMGHEFYVLLSGAAHVSRDGLAVALLGPGDFFGELALLDPYRRDATVTVTEEAYLLEITQREFWELLTRVPALDRKILQALARRLHNYEREGFLQTQGSST